MKTLFPGKAISNLTPFKLEAVRRDTAQALHKILLALFIASLPFITNAEPKYGYDVLGVARYCDEYLLAPKLPAVSTLMGTFGDPLPCIEKRIQLGNLTDVQVDLIDATCWRNRNCVPGVPRPDDLRVIRDRASKVNTLAVKYPSVKFLLSPALEHDIKDPRKVQDMCKAAISGCPSCSCINSPVSGARPSNIPLELHGNTNKAFSVSNDGSSIFDSDSVKYRTNGSDYVFGWFHELNLRFSGEKTFTPPMQRKCRPSADLFRQTYLILKEPEPKAEYPSLCRTKRDIKSDEILKTNAESYCDGDIRGNKPLLISKIRASKLPVIDSRGREIACFRLYGAFSGKPGYNRHYIGNCSGETPTKLYDEAKGEWAFIKNGSECIRFNTIRRLGSYR